MIHFFILGKQQHVGVYLVRSFGTENRPTERPIPPRNEVFELIIFRGSDIKDLHVSEPPNKPPTPAAASWPQDPAIVEVSFWLALILMHIVICNSFYYLIFIVIVIR